MAGTYSRLQHDIGVVDPSDSTNVMGLVCARDDKGQIQYQEFDEEYLAQQFFTGGASYVNTPPQRRILMSLSDYRSGFGQNIYDGNDPKRYYSSFGCDLSVKGRAMAGWNSTATTSLAFPSITDGGLEIWTDANTLTNWTYSETDADASLTRESTIVDTGTYSAKIAFTGASGGGNPYGQILQTAVTWNSLYQGITCTVTARVYNSDITKLKGQLIIDDGVGTTTANSAGSGSWETVTCTRTLNAAATKFDVILRGYQVTNNAAQTYFDTVTITRPDNGTVDCHADFNGSMYFSRGDCLFKMNSSGTISCVQSFTADITALIPFQVSGTDYLFIFLGTSTDYQYMTAAEAFTTSNAVVKRFQFGAWVNTTVDTLYANDGDNTVRSTTNPLNGGVAWSGQTIVGSAADAITHLQEKDGALLIDKEDMPYYLDGSGNVQKDLAPECLSGKSSHSGKNSTTWQGVYYRPTGDQALLKAGATNEWIQPAKYATNSGDFSGQVEAVAGDEEWLYLVSDNSTKVEIFKGREETIDGSTRQVWHPIHELTLAGCETAWISTVYQKRLWISSTSSADSLYYLPLPTKYGDIENDTNASFKTATYWETPYLHGDFPADTKGWIKIVATLAHSYDADIYWQAQYKKLEDSSYTNIGNLKGTATDRTHTLYLPVDSSSNNPVSSMMRFKLIAITDTTAKTPVLTNLLIEAVLYPPDGAGKIIACTIKNIKTMLTAKGGEPEKGSQTKTQELFDNIFSATYPFTIYDIEGTARTVKSMPLPSGTPRRYPIRKAGMEIDWYYNLMLQTIETS